MPGFFMAGQNIWLWYSGKGGLGHGQQSSDNRVPGPLVQLGGDSVLPGFMVFAKTAKGIGRASLTSFSHVSPTDSWKV